VEQDAVEGNGFVHCIMAGDENWFYNFDLETKQQSMVWPHTTLAKKNKLKIMLLAHKTMRTVFWDV
jgi:hypothetical protein